MGILNWINIDKIVQLHTEANTLILFQKNNTFVYILEIP